MKLSEIISGAYKGVAYLYIVLVLTSCNKGNDVGGKGDNVNVGVGNPTGAVEAPTGLTQIERLEAECRRLLVGTKRKRGEKSTFLALNDLCNEIRMLPKEEALPLFDKWIDMAIEQPITNTNYSVRAALFEQSFHVVQFAFLSSLNMRTDPFEHWDKVFRFYAKCTDEIMAMEKHLENQGRPQHSPYYLYLRLFRGDVKNWIHIIRCIFPTELSKGLTEEQKADVLRRFDELKKYTDTPSDFPGGKK